MAQWDRKTHKEALNGTKTHSPAQRGKRGNRGAERSTQWSALSGAKTHNDAQSSRKTHNVAHAYLPMMKFPYDANSQRSRPKCWIVTLLIMARLQGQKRLLLGSRSRSFCKNTYVRPFCNKWRHCQSQQRQRSPSASQQRHCHTSMLPRYLDLMPSKSLLKDIGQSHKANNKKRIDHIQCRYYR